MAVARTRVVARGGGGEVLEFGERVGAHLNGVGHGPMLREDLRRWRSSHLIPATSIPVHRHASLEPKIGGGKRIPYNEVSSGLSFFSSYEAIG
jgi:hypothetical protein